MLWALLITALLRPPTRPAWLLSLYLCVYGGVTGVGTLAGFLNLINRPRAVAAFEAGLVLAAGAVWLLRGRPGLFAPLKGLRADLGRGGFWPRVKSRPELALLGLGVGLAYLVCAVLIVVVPPNNNDSLSTHLSRVGYWLQFGSLYPWPTSRLMQLYYPVNAQLQMLWTVLFWGSDVLVGFVQWGAALACSAAVFGLARLLGFNRCRSAFAAFIFASFPLVLLQSTTPQNDLVAAALLVAEVYFLALGLQKRQPAMLMLSGAALGLGLGTKQTLYFTLPGIGLLALLLLMRQRGKTIHLLLGWAGFALAGFVLFAAPQNLLNLRTFGLPFGPPEAMSQSVGGLDVSSALNNVLYNVPRLLYQAVDVSGLPNPLDGYVHKVVAAVSGRFFKLIHFPIEGTRYTTPPHVFSLALKTQNQEDHAWYGPLSGLLLLPAMLWQFVRGIRSREPLSVGLVLNAALFLLIDAWLRPGWDPFQGRYFAPVVALNAPLMAALAGEKPLARAGRWLAVVLALMILTTTLLYNPAKPLAGKKARNVDIWTADRVTVQTIQGFFSREMLRMVDDQVPGDAVLGLYAPGYVWDYPLFGKQFTRRVIPVYPFEKSSDLTWLRQQGIQYLLVQPDQPPAVLLPDSVKWLAEAAGWRLYRVPAN